MEKVKSFSFANIIKSALISVLISIGSILCFAIVLKFVDLNDSVIKIINQVIKIISIFFGVFVMLKSNKEKGLYKGLLLGLLYSVVALVVFSMLDNKLSFGLNNLLDILFSCIFGSICGVFCANFGITERLN